MKASLPAAVCLFLLAPTASISLHATPQEQAGSLSRGQAALYAARSGDAARATGSACTGETKDASRLVSCGDACFRQGDFTAAEQRYSEAVAADPKNGRAYWNLGRLDLIERRNRSARQHFTRAHELDPDDPSIALDWALTLPTRTARAAAAERALVLAERQDTHALAGVRARVAILKALGDDETFVVAHPDRAYRLELHEAVGPDGPLNAYRLVALVNGEKLRLTLDTGTSGIYLNRNAAERSHLVRLADGVPVSGVGRGATRTSVVALADTMRIGDLEMTRCEVKVDSGRAFEDADGLIGTDVFSHFLVRLSLPARTLELLPLAEGEQSIARNFWEVERQSRPGFTPVHVLGHLLLADARVDNVPGFLLIVDSGSPTHVLSTSAARRVAGLRPANAVVRGVSGRADQAMTMGKAMLSFGNQSQPGTFLAVNLDEQNRRAGTEIGGMIGLDALRRFDLTIDYTNGLVRFDGGRDR